MRGRNRWINIYHKDQEIITRAVIRYLYKVRGKPRPFKEVVNGVRQRLNKKVRSESVSKAIFLLSGTRKRRVEVWSVKRGFFAKMVIPKKVKG